MKIIPPLLFTMIVLFAGTTAVGNAATMHDSHAMHGDTVMHDNHAMLTEPGNDTFGTLQEALQKLLADPDTDWSKVNMEALRQHLVDMRNFTQNVDVVSQTPVANGLEVILQPFDARVSESLDRVFAAHPAQLKRETGLDMRTEKQTVKQTVQYKITITAGNEADAVKIRGLGYIGVMVWGNHHQSHHWMMVKGGNPH